MASRTTRRVSRWLSGAVSAVLMVLLAACSSTGGKAPAKKAAGGAPASTSAPSKTGSSPSSSTTAAQAGGAVTVYYIPGQPTHTAEVLAMGTADFPATLSSANLQVQVRALPAGADPGQAFLSLANENASLQDMVVCSCAALPAAVLAAKTNGVPLVQQQTTAGAAFFYSVGATSTTPPQLQPLTTALAALRKEEVAKGQSFVTSFLQQHFGETPNHALQTFDALAGKPVLASAADLQVDEVDFYPMLGWGFSEEYMTQSTTVTNITENALTGLQIPVPPGATDIHSGTWGTGWPPFTGKPVTVSNGEITLSAPLPPLQTITVSFTYRASSATASAWPTFSWTLPYPAKKVQILLARYYVVEGDGVHTSLPSGGATDQFAVWSATNLAGGQTITFQPFTPSHAPLE
jgi:hypothetical protein